MTRSIRQSSVALAVAWACTLTVAFVTPRAQAANTPREVEQDGVRIRVTVQAHKYIWKITNISAPPIKRFEITPHNCYNYQGPTGWSVEINNLEFRASTITDEWAIRPGSTGVFTAQYSSSGAVLGSIPATIGFGGTAPAVEFASVWGATPPPRSLVKLLALTIIGLALVHTGFVAWRERRAAC